jgi:hypothetical protein
LSNNLITDSIPKVLGTRGLLLNNGEITAKLGGERHPCPAAAPRILSSLPFF